MQWQESFRKRGRLSGKQQSSDCSLRFLFETASQYLQKRICAGYTLQMIFTFLMKYKYYIISILPITVFLLWPVSSSDLKKIRSAEIYSSDGKRLRTFQNESGHFSSFEKLENFPEHLVKYLVLLEDKRFYYHPGFDPIAVCRAIYSNVSGGRLTSGASTLTQQTARIVNRDFFPKNIYLRKILEIFYAVRYEIHFTKKEILEIYLNSVPVRSNLEGFPSAAQAIFQKNVSFLSKQESFSLVLLLRNNSQSETAFRKRWIMSSDSADLGIKEVPEDIIRIIYHEKYSIQKQEDRNTDHYEAFLRKIFPNEKGRIVSSLDVNLNTSLRNVIREEMEYMNMHHVTNAAVIVLKLPKDGERFLELKAMVGSRDYFESLEGQVNGTAAYRHAGSTMKPLLYALAFEMNLIGPETILDDSKVFVPIPDGGVYSPKNNDLQYWGKMTASEALANSRNIPAVKIITMTGVSRFRETLLNAGLSHLVKSPDYYGPGLSLGNGGVSLIQLTRAYTVFSENGILYPILMGKNEEGRPLSFGEEKKVFSRETADRIKYILSEKELRRRAFGERNFFDFPFDAAVKTGTSKDHRDAWAAGFSAEYAVGVWVGNFDGSSMNRITGGWGAGRIFHQILRTLHGVKKLKFNYSENLKHMQYCRKTGKAAGEKCSKITALSPKNSFPEVCSLSHSGNSVTEEKDNFKEEILAPASGEIFVLDKTADLEHQKIPVKLKLKKGVQYSLRLNGNSHPVSEKFFLSVRKGKYRLELFHNEELSDKKEFTVKE